MKLKFPYFNDSDVGYLDYEFLNEDEIVQFIDEDEEEVEENNENSKILK